MALGVLVFIAWIAFMALTVIAFLAWAVKENQLHDIEEPKYRMLEDRELEPWPGRDPAPESGSSSPAPGKDQGDKK